jgi:seryl-tRNA synthetase
MELSLIATAEITVGGFLADSVYKGESLPLRFVADSHCFRREAGAAGRESRGLYRVHQFDKIEMYCVCTPEQSHDILEGFLAVEEEIYQKLGIPYRVLRICAGDLGAPAYKKYDVEGWMPGKGDAGDYGEITSTSNCTDFQARRLNIKYKDKEGKREFAHTLNGTAIALSRTVLCILENYQQADGSVIIPEVLRQYTGFDVIKPATVLFDSHKTN